MRWAIDLHLNNGKIDRQYYSSRETMRNSAAFYRVYADNIVKVKQIDLGG